MTAIGLGLGIPFAATLNAGGGEPPAFELDHLDNIYAAHSLKRVLSSYSVSSPLVRLRRGSDNVEADFAAGPDRWVDASAITTWLGGATGYVTTLYDLTGNSRPAVQTSTALQPTINLSGTWPSLAFASASSQNMVIPAANGFSRNVGALSLIGVRKATALTASYQYILSCASGGGADRAALNFDNASNAELGGRRLDTDTYASVDVAADTAWHTQIGRFDYANSNAHIRVDDLSASNTSFQTDGNTSDTDSSVVRIGSNGTPSGGSYLNGELRLIALVSDLLTDVEDAALPDLFSDLVR